MGFVSPTTDGLLEKLGVALDPRKNVLADTKSYKSSATRSSPAATCAAASRWWSGRSAKGASALRASTPF